MMVVVRNSKIIRVLVQYTTKQARSHNVHDKVLSAVECTRKPIFILMKYIWKFSALFFLIKGGKLLNWTTRVCIDSCVVRSVANHFDVLELYNKIIGS